MENKRGPEDEDEKLYRKLAKEFDNIPADKPLVNSDKEGYNAWNSLAGKIVSKIVLVLVVGILFATVFGAAYLILKNITYALIVSTVSAAVFGWFILTNIKQIRKMFGLDLKSGYFEVYREHIRLMPEDRTIPLDRLLLVKLRRELHNMGEAETISCEAFLDLGAEKMKMIVDEYRFDRLRAALKYVGFERTGYDNYGRIYEHNAKKRTGWM